MVKARLKPKPRLKFPILMNIVNPKLAFKLPCLFRIYANVKWGFTNRWIFSSDEDSSVV